MGWPACHGTWVHLYINGLYWGVYNPTERPDASFMASYYGGSAGRLGRRKESRGDYSW